MEGIDVKGGTATPQRIYVSNEEMDKLIGPRTQMRPKPSILDRLRTRFRKPSNRLRHGVPTAMPTNRWSTPFNKSYRVHVQYVLGVQQADSSQLLADWPQTISLIFPDLIKVKGFESYYSSTTKWQSNASALIR